MNRPWILIALLLTAASCAAGSDASRPDDVDPALWQRLTAIDQRARKITDFSADFEQRRHTLLLKEPLTSHGRVLVKGTSMLWRTTRPHEHSVLVTQREVRLYYPRQKLLEIYPLRDRLADLAASPVPRLENMVRLFTIEAASAPEEDDKAGPPPLRLKLTPRDEELQRHVTSVVVEVDEATGTLSAFELVDGDGERTAIRFAAAAINAGLTDEQMTLKVPKGTTVSRPLEGARE